MLHAGLEWSFVKLDAHIDNAEMMAFLGYGDQVLDNSLQARIDAARETCEREMSVQGIYRIFPVRFIKEDLARVPRVYLEDTPFTLPGASISRFLEGAREVALLACTLGLQSEMILRRERNLSVADGLLFDAAASALVENGADKLSALISQEAAERGLRAGTRFSPGYGDLSLDVQPGLLLALDAGKTLGITTTESSMLVPSKSITAVMGLFPLDAPSSEEVAWEAEDEKLTGPCRTCPQRHHCILRAQGKTCHGI